MNTQNIKTAASESSERWDDVPFYRYIRLSMQHVSMQDALTLSYLSDQFDAQGIETHNWILNTGPTNGFLICLDSCEDALMQLEQRGVTQELCNTIRLLTETLSISMIHFDDTAAALKGIPVYEW
jgi:hypothetical protein